jgi:hypothetical protein
LFLCEVNYKNGQASFIIVCAAALPLSATLPNRNSSSGSYAILNVEVPFQPSAIILLQQPKTIGRFFQPATIVIRACLPTCLLACLPVACVRA